MPNRKELKDCLLEAGDAAKRVLIRHHGKKRSFQLKSPANLVTEADHAAERAIVRVIRRHFPDHGILAEESGDATRPESPFLWVIDPLDGTSNFAHGVPRFVSSIALLQDGSPRMGLVIDPVRDETFFAERGHGARLNGRPIHVSETTALDDALLVTEFPHDRRREAGHLMRMVQAFVQRAQGLRFGGAMAIDLAWIACGRLDGIWQNGPEAWDMAAGILLVQEAGGRVTRMNGKPLDLYQNQAVASNGRIHDQMLAVLREHWTPYRGKSIND